VNTRAPASTLPSITTRPSPAEKARFASIAASRGMTESALALSAIRSYLGSDPAIRASILNEPQIRATDRITIRLRPGDGRWIARRAQERGMKSSAYLAALVRAHVACDPPLPMEEIRILKRAVTVLVDLGRIVNNKIPTEITRDDLRHACAAVAHVEKRLQDFAKASLVAWESRLE
jgi:hypothetical protein